MCQMQHPLLRPGGFSRHAIRRASSYTKSRMAKGKASDSLRAEAKTKDTRTSQQSGDDNDDEREHLRAGDEASHRGE